MGTRLARTAQPDSAADRDTAERACAASNTAGLVRIAELAGVFAAAQLGRIAAAARARASAAGSIDGAELAEALRVAQP